jgi:hypothetical protein
LFPCSEPWRAAPTNGYEQDAMFAIGMHEGQARVERVIWETSPGVGPACCGGVVVIVAVCPCDQGSYLPACVGLKSDLSRGVAAGARAGRST